MKYEKKRVYFNTSVFGFPQLVCATVKEWDASAGKLPVAGRDFVINEEVVANNVHWIM